MIIVFDGPNKAGKSTLIDTISKKLDGVKVPNKIRHWGELKTDDREYTESLVSDMASDDVVLWDRSWASEHVYAVINGRKKRRLYNDPWLGEFLHSRGVKLNGFVVMVVPALAGQNLAMQDEVDRSYAPDIYEERALFNEYGLAFHWNMVYNDYTKEFLGKASDEIVAKIVMRMFNKNKIAFISSNEEKYIDGGWVPFSAKQDLDYARSFAYTTFAADWWNLSDVTPERLAQYDQVIVTSKMAAESLKAYKSDLGDKQVTVLTSSTESGPMYDRVLTMLREQWYAKTHEFYIT